MYLKVLPKVAEVFIFIYYIRLRFWAMGEFHPFNDIFSIPIIPFFELPNLIVLNIVNVVELIRLNQI